MVSDQQQEILVTGGAGYVGSHSVLLLLEQNYRVIVIDNCSNAYIEGYDSNGNVQKIPESLRRVEELANRSLLAFYKLDLVSEVESINNVFRKHNIRAVIHFAALKSVSESISQPIEYYTNNLVGTINLLGAMKRFGCKDLIFSSSATVYGLPQYVPIDEDHQVGMNVLNPYGRTKCMIEEVLKDITRIPNQIEGNSNSRSSWNIISLRYFNPIGAHFSGYIGEHTTSIPNNLMPYISQVAVGKRDKLYIFGNDFDTVDGTGVRDYIHIMDLARGHTHALTQLLKENCGGGKSSKYRAYNLGTGKGYSVLEVIQTFKEVNKVEIPYEIIGRREGDAGKVYADASLANKELEWSATHSLVDMCRDTYNWQVSFPDGFKTKKEDIQHIKRK